MGMLAGEGPLYPAWYVRRHPISINLSCLPCCHPLLRSGSGCFLGCPSCCLPGLSSWAKRRIWFEGPRCFAVLSMTMVLDLPAVLMCGWGYCLLGDSRGRPVHLSFIDTSSW